MEQKQPWESNCKHQETSYNNIKMSSEDEEIYKMSSEDEMSPPAKKAKTTKTKTAQPKLDPNAQADVVFRKGKIEGLQFSSAGVLLTHETDENSFYLSQDDLKEILNKRGGKYVSNVSKSTTIFILGDMEREGEVGKKGKRDPSEVYKWEGSKKYKDLQQQLSSKTSNIRQMGFEEFMAWFDLEEACFLYSRIAQFDASRFPPGIGRTRTRLFGATLMREGTEKEDPHHLYRPRDRPSLFLPGFRAKQAAKLEASKHLGYKRAVIPESERIASASSSSSSSAAVQEGADQGQENNNDDDDDADDDSTDTDDDD